MMSLQQNKFHSQDPLHKEKMVMITILHYLNGQNESPLEQIDLYLQEE